MHNRVAIRFAIVATAALGCWSSANADSSSKVVAAPGAGQQAAPVNAGPSFKVVTAPSDGQQAPAVNSGSSFKVVASPAKAKQSQAEVAQGVVPSPDEFNPNELRRGQ